MKTLIPLSVLGLMAFTCCYKDKFQERHPKIPTASSGCDTNKTISFASDIAPALNNSCGTNNSCHGSSNTSGIDLSTYSGVSSFALGGSLYSSVVWDGNASQMPKGSSSKIPACDIAKIRLWIGAGAPNN